MRVCSVCNKTSPKTSWKISIDNIVEQEKNKKNKNINIHYRVQYGECPYCHSKTIVYKDQFYISDMF